MSRRWQHLYELQPRPLLDWALDQLAEQLHQDLARWPPPELEWADARRARASRWCCCARRRRRSRRSGWRWSWRGLELLHEVERIDFFLRSSAARAELPDSLEEQSALFLARWLVESCFSIRDAAPEKLKRSDLLELLERLERRVLGSAAPLRI